MIHRLKKAGSYLELYNAKKVFAPFLALLF